MFTILCVLFFLFLIGYDACDIALTFLFIILLCRLLGYN
jgi:hypothetical protein